MGLARLGLGSLDSREIAKFRIWGAGSYGGRRRFEHFIYPTSKNSIEIRS